MQVVNEEAKRLGIVLDWSKGQGNAPMQATSVAQGAIATDE
jgi:hypothetical protein